MSPGRPSRAAELGADPHHLAAVVYHALEKADARGTHSSPMHAAEVAAATAQAAAIALLAVHVGRLADAMEADVANIARTAELPFPTPPGAPR